MKKLSRVMKVLFLAIVVSVVGVSYAGVLDDDEPKPQPKKYKKVQKPVIKPKHHRAKKERSEPEPEARAVPEASPVVAPEKQAFEPEMVAIKGGCFQMGSPESEPERYKNEKQHKVCVENFEIGKYEVTQAQWQAVMGNNPSSFKGENLPVEQVSWNDVQSFIEKLNAKTGKSYRLPTEAQWEYAARANTTTPFYTGNCINTNQANYDGNYDYNNCGAKTGAYKQKTVAVGSYSANGFGLHDMAGNVWEWTCSDYVENYDGSETKCSSGSGTLRAIRGGSWSYYPGGLRSATRSSYAPDTRFYDVGVRLSRM